jgi:magnesium chelatase accessory protein
MCVSRLPTREQTASPRKRLLLLHGNPANMHDFGLLAAFLRDEYELAALDLPGFGWSESVRPLRHESVLHTYARHVQAAASRIGWNEDYFILGHSHGAAVAQTVAALFPERIAGLILLGSVGTPTHWGYRHLVLPGVATGLRMLVKALSFPNPQSVRRRIVKEIMTPIFAPAPLAEAWIEEQLAVVDRRPEILVTMGLVATGNPCDQLARSRELIRSPALFIHGDSDFLVPEDNARSIYEVVARSAYAEFHTLPRTGHMLQLSHPREVHALMRPWFARLEAHAVQPARYLDRTA